MKNHIFIRPKKFYSLSFTAEILPKFARKRKVPKKQWTVHHLPRSAIDKRSVYYD